MIWRVDTTYGHVSFPLGVFSNCDVTPNNSPKVKLFRHDHELWIHGCCCCLVTKSGLSQPTRLLCPWGFPGKNTAVGCHFLLQGIFLTQGSNPHLLLGRRILYHWGTQLKQQLSNKTRALVPPQGIHRTTIWHIPIFQQKPKHPTQVEDGDNMLTTSTQTPCWLKPAGWWWR